jgi:hypothetical protein
MADNLRHAGGQDRTRINVHQEHELRDPADKFQVPRSRSRRRCAPWATGLRRWRCT